MRKELSLVIVAVALALIAVQSASLLQSPPAAALMKGQSVMETTASLRIDQSTSVSLSQTIAWVVIGPLAIAALCYLFVRKKI